MRKKRYLRVGIMLLAAVLLIPSIAVKTGAQGFTPDPKTEYASAFLEKCEGQRWFIDELERLLNQEQKTLNAVSGAADFKNIKSIGLTDRQINGAIPAAIGELTELQYLFLSGNQLSGQIPTELFGLKKLQSIDLEGNCYTGSIPPGFGQMPALKSLTLEGNQFSGTIPDSILRNEKIEVLNVRANALTGGIPAGITGMTGLKYLNLSQNPLGGSLPDVSVLERLIALSAWDCQLTGTIPDGLYSMTGLQILDLSTNQLEGEISPSLAKLTALQYLALDTNRFGGLLPEEFLPVSVQEVHLENNRLRGHVPATLKAREDAGVTIYLTNNYLTGEVLKSMQYHAENFADGASTAQHQLTSSQLIVHISMSSWTDLYPYLEKLLLTTGASSKVALEPEDFTITVNGERVELVVDGSGIRVRARTLIPLSEGFTITIQIKGNEDSAYSTVKIILTTDRPGVLLVNNHRAYISGYPDGTFRADAPITREQAAKMLITALDQPAEQNVVASYTDVSPANWSYAWIEAATREGYLQGYSDGTFGPLKPITRAEMAAVLVRIAERQGYSADGSEKHFSDVQSDAWYAEYIRKATMYGFISGYGDGTFRPDQSITRAEAVVMINRLLQRDYSTATELQVMRCPFCDVSPQHWAYGDIMEASVDHRH